MPNKDRQKSEPNVKGPKDKGIKKGRNTNN
jgi:hypothetical protein